jgi:predicted permease
MNRNSTTARALLRTPWFTTATIALLALGIGTTSAMFSVASSVLVRELPVMDQDRIVGLWATAPGSTSEVSTSFGRVERFRRVSRTLVGIAGFAHFGSNAVPIVYGDAALSAQEALVSGNFFTVLGARPVLGRFLRSDDDVRGAAPVVVISEGFWRGTFNADSSVIGRQLRLRNRELSATIVGIAPAGLDYPRGADYWFPIVPSQYPAVDMIGRLAAGATPATARAEFAAFIATDTRDHPEDAVARSLSASGAIVEPFLDLIVGPARQALILLSAAGAGLLVIACVNVGSLMLVRAAARAREIAVRRALGATSYEIFKQLSSEAAMLIGGGAVLGIAVAMGLVRLLVAAAPPGLPRLAQITLSPSATLAAVAAAGLSLFAVAVMPAFLIGHHVSSALRGDARAGIESVGRRRVRRAMVASQLALALVLTFAAALVVRSLQRLEDIDLGFAPRHLSILRLSATYTKYRTPIEFNDAFDDVRRRMLAVPGVTAATPILGVPFLGANVFSARFEAQDRPDLRGADAPYASFDAVGADFSTTFGAPILRGRGVSEDDREESAPVAVITADFAKRFWPNENPIGKRIRMASLNDTTWQTVVGVVGPLRYRTMRAPTPTVLFPYRQEFQQGIYAIRTSTDLAAVLPMLRRAISAGDPDIALWRAQTMDEALAEPLSRPRMETVLFTTFGALALLLACVGLYGVTAHLVRQRTREFGIRIALGATSRAVLRESLGEAMITVGIGLAAGLVVSLIGSRFVGSLLFDVSVSDPSALSFAGCVFALTAIAAAYLPARRATKVDPVIALRTD